MQRYYIFTQTQTQTQTFCLTLISLIFYLDRRNISLLLYKRHKTFSLSLIKFKLDFLKGLKEIKIIKIIFCSSVLN